MKRYLKLVIICILIVGIPLGLFKLVIAHEIRQLDVQDEYLDNMDQRFIVINQSIYSLEQLARDHEPTETWSNKVVKSLEDIEKEALGFKKLSPPRGLERVHKLYLEASEVYQVSTEEMAAKLSNLDQNSAFKMIEMIRAGNQIFLKGSELATEIK